MHREVQVKDHAIIPRLGYLCWTVGRRKRRSSRPPLTTTRPSLEGSRLPGRHVGIAQTPPTGPSLEHIRSNLAACVLWPVGRRDLRRTCFDHVFALSAARNGSTHSTQLRFCTFNCARPPPPRHYAGRVLDFLFSSARPKWLSWVCPEG